MYSILACVIVLILAMPVQLLVTVAVQSSYAISVMATHRFDAPNVQVLRYADYDRIHNASHMRADMTGIVCRQNLLSAQYSQICKAYSSGSLCYHMTLISQLSSFQHMNNICIYA